jgi:protein O-GlcNAc transferase
MSGLCEGDIFLDTPDFNGHTTAVDSVWAGVPIITAATEKMVGRVASSILASADLSLLIARTRGEYAMLGRAMLDSRLRSRLRSRVVEARGTRLFDTETWVRGLEVGMRCAWDSLAGVGLDERRAFHVLVAR